MTNIQKVAKSISQMKNKERVKAALELLIEPRVDQSSDVDQELGASVANVFSRLDITTLNQKIG